jgi:hypothetical protein
MVTSIQSVNGPVILPQVANAGTPQPQTDTPNAGTSSTEKISISPAAGIQLGQDQTIAAGKLVNQADQTLAKQQDTLKKMNDNLTAIVKQFPPYGAQDPQRLAYLNSFSGLRQQIEELQIPRNPQAESGMPKQINLPSQDQGLSLPKLDSTASDKQIADAAQSVQTAIVQVSGQRADLSQSVHAALGGSSYSSLLQKLAY